MPYFFEKIRLIIPIIINKATPKANTTERTENNHATNGNKQIIPPPMNTTPKHPGNKLSSEPLSFFPELRIAYPIGIAIIAIIKPVKTSSPPGKPRSGALGSYP